MVKKLVQALGRLWGQGRAWRLSIARIVRWIVICMHPAGYLPTDSNAWHALSPVLTSSTQRPHFLPARLCTYRRNNSLPCQGMA